MYIECEGVGMECECVSIKCELHNCDGLKESCRR